MFFETFLILLSISLFLIWWGYNSKNTGIFLTGGVIIIILGVLLQAGGLTTSNFSVMTTTKTIIDGNTTYTNVPIYQNISVAQDTALWATSFCMIIIGSVGTLSGLALIRKK